jgi:hypothetical protein
MAFRRRNKLPKEALQVALIVSFLAVGLFFLTLQYIFAVQSFSEIAGGADDFYLREVLLDSAFRSFLSTVALFIPLAVVVGVLITFRTAGPIFRIERHLESIAAGKDPGVCKLRKGDALQGLCDVLNRAVASLRTERTPQNATTLSSDDGETSESTPAQPQLSEETATEEASVQA